MHSQKRENESISQLVLIITFVLILQISGSISLYLPLWKSTAYFPIKNNMLAMQQQ